MSRRSGKRRATPYKWLETAAGPGPGDKPPHTDTDPTGPLTASQFAAAEYMSVEWPPPPGAPASAPAIHLSLKILNKSVKIGEQSKATFNFIPTEDSIHPYPLSFDPPLAALGSPDAEGFRRYWEKLTYVFDLPDPAEFPLVPVTGDDRQLLERFVTMSRRLARFSLVNRNTSLSVGKSGEHWRVQVLDPPSDESFLGASAAFRQLHNDRETASFSKCYNTLFKALQHLPDEDRAYIAPVLQAWRAARRQLMQHTIQTLTTMKATRATLDKPISYRNIRPDALIKAFNYGDSLHFNINNDLVDLLTDEQHEAYYTYGALISILGLTHLYFGFSALLEHALGE